jgi:type I restriction enzyme, S subunit
MNDEQTINGLPKNWKEIQLGKACEKISLNGIKIKQKEYLQEGKYPVVDQGQDMVGGYFNDDKLVIPEEPPYVVFGDHTRVKKFVTFKFIAGADGVKVLKPSADFDPKFFYYSLYMVNIPDKGYARHFQFLEKAFIPLPPKDTQKQIVSKIEELFSELDKSIEELKTAQEQLNIYRQAVLKWAFEGKLTNEDVKDDTLPEGWRWEKIEEATISLDNKRKPVNKAERLSRQGNIPYYGANGQVGWIDDYIFDEPLVCVVEDETVTGREIPFSYKITGKTWVNNHAHVLKPRNGLNIDFLNYQLFYYPFLNLTTGTTGRKKLTKNALMNAPLKVCPIEEQQQIVQKIESRLSVCDKVEETITNSLKQAEALRQSILKKAFEGRLVI